MTNEALEPIRRLEDVAGRYRAVFCDVWGVVHDGVAKHPEAERALIDARRAGAAVVLLTNSPRPSAGVRAQLDGLGVSHEAYDAVVTSGDATRALIGAGPREVLHIGAARDLDLFHGLDLDFVDEDEARAVVVTGLLHDEEETPDDYRALLSRLAARDLPMVCANPDIVVHRGPRLIYCAGALAAVYAEHGAPVALAGKPHAPIYAVARALLAPGAEGPILCIGDGMFTDVQGANGIDADCLFIADGIHRDELAGAAGRPEALAAALAVHGFRARFVQPALR